MIKIDTYSNMTIWDLKKIIAKKCKISPLKVQLNRGDIKKKAITEADNIRMLSDVKIESFELLTA